MSTHDMLHRLSETLISRRNADPSTSYTAQLFANGPDSILKKIGEECAELIMASKDGKRRKVGAIALRESKLIENQILQFLEADEGNLEKLVAKLIFEYQSAAANEGTKLDLA